MPPGNKQAQLSLFFGGLGLCSLALHSSSAFLASFSASGVGNTNNLHLQQSLIIFNSQVSHSDAVTIESVLADQPRQRSLSQKLDRHLFESLLMSSPANKARLLSASDPHASLLIPVALHILYQYILQQEQYSIGASLISVGTKELSSEQQGHTATRSTTQLVQAS